MRLLLCVCVCGVCVLLMLLLLWMCVYFLCTHSTQVLYYTRHIIHIISIRSRSAAFNRIGLTRVPNIFRQNGNTLDGRYGCCWCCCCHVAPFYSHCPYLITVPRRVFPSAFMMHLMRCPFVCIHTVLCCCASHIGSHHS